MVWKRKMTKKPYTFIDLFAGIGGFHLALKKEAECVFVSEWNEQARQTYLLNFGEEMLKNNIPFEADITNIDEKDVPNHTILCGGFPCQPFSIAGLQKGFSHPTQGNLFFDIIRIVKEKKPRVLFLENVKNLKSHDKGNTFKVICETLEKEGYTIHHAILNGTIHGNVPQNRERIFLVCFKDKEDSAHFKFPSAIELKKTINDIVDISQKKPEKYYQTNLDSPSVKKMVASIQNKGSIYQYRRYYLRENKNGVCPTLTANMGMGGHNVPLLKDNYGIRKLTPKECILFQGFPKSYKLPAISDSHLYKQAGNSVVVPVIERIAKNIIKALKKTDTEKQSI